MLEARDMTLQQRRPATVIHHSEKGCPYTVVAFGNRCRQQDVRRSMGSVGNCYDNTLAESFFAILECELLQRGRFQCRAQAKQALSESIEGWYNPRLCHSRLEQQSPLEFENRHPQAV